MSAKAGTGVSAFRAARAVMSVADTYTDDEILTMWIGNMLQMVAAVRAKKPRDPFRAMEDALLDFQSEMLE